MEYTVIGDAVNRAARYCDKHVAAKYLSVQVYQSGWKITEASSVTRDQHEGNLPGFRVKDVKGAKAMTLSAAARNSTTQVECFGGLAAARHRAAFFEVAPCN
jgi:hypothetical protein